ncbi:uroporphyrinogen-III C-methyltransferase [Thalassotalea sp. Y01]|uniref:uroporphyrinogen-III C-methyltransferase n=1 Tax=Thalassotalea sp. Y01 TaxID=2729613 RepID=UPI00145DB20C|nr:uroporphyrinogen-III C-methyltransferase [Thalassotalea sp. Y01]NMP17373.1 uroporphyrinogen-III C-methyltransferase [Thalassotalea sp. Y01]
MDSLTKIQAKSQFVAGEVALIGAGPGDAELLTIKAMRFLQQADVIIYDRLVSREIVNLTPANCQRLYVGKAVHKQCVSQQEINNTLQEKAKQGLKVVRLKGGDSFIFGRGSEEIDYLLEHNVSCHIIPGITAASGATTYAGIPLTHRDVAYSCSFITGHFKHDGELDLPWHEYVNSKQTLVFYMGIGNAGIIESKLLEHGKSPDTPVAIVYRGTQNSQQVWRTTLAKINQCIDDNNIKAPSLIVMGAVVDVLQQHQLSSKQPAYFLGKEAEHAKNRTSKIASMKNYA